MTPLNPLIRDEVWIETMGRVNDQPSNPAGSIQPSDLNEPSHLAENYVMTVTTMDLQKHEN